MHPALALLLPQPRSVRPSNRYWRPDPRALLAADLPSGIRTPAPAARDLKEALAAHAVTGVGRPAGEAPSIRLGIDPSIGASGANGDPRTGAYRLDIDESGARILAGEERGLNHGLRTLAQLLRGCAPGQVPCVAIEDAPSFSERGVMLDVSRDRVPTLDQLFEFIEELARWKVNRLELYTEHTFAFRGYEEVWAGADPLTAEEIRQLDTYCAERFIELVPNQQCFGHMHRWLIHERLRPLAECPEGVEHPFSRTREPFSLCPTDPRSLELVTDLIDQLRSCFGSTTLNVGCDETFDLGLGRSRSACAARGTVRVYLDFLVELASRLEARGMRMEFWADILLTQPELARELPENVVPMLWGYEADHPFGEQARALATSGRDFHICPGTSSWQSFAGRFSNMIGNVESAARAARTHGARGLLITDWGDRGHLQPWVAGYPGWLTGADLAWNADADAARRTRDGLAALMNRHVFRLAPTPPAQSASLGQAAIDLACIAEETGARVANASPLSVIVTKSNEPLPPPELTGLEIGGLQHALSRIEAAVSKLEGPASLDERQTLLVDELRLAAGLMRFAAHLGIARLAFGPERPISELPADERNKLAAELRPLIAQHREQWPRRTRPGGLPHSCSFLERPLSELGGG